jgi:DNA-binding NarL/FixJ family response regulator
MENLMLNILLVEDDEVANEEQDRIHAYDLNVAGYILKPVTFSIFVELMITLNKYWTLCEMA